jgi:hypothetical protein
VTVVLRALAGAIILTGTAGAASADARCHDVLAGEPASLTGELIYTILPGPPNYADVQAGDTPEPTYLLHLDAPICITDSGDFADPDHQFGSVHVVPGNATGRLIGMFVGLRVTVTFSDRWAAHTGHHKAPLVAVASAVTEAEDPTSEYGTSATVVRAFYLALRAGAGEVATSFVIPEKQAKGPLSASSLSAFYGRMEEPLELLGIEPISDRDHLVRYRFRKGGNACAGRAEVRTVDRKGRNYIERIKALDGC